MFCPTFLFIFFDEKHIVLIIRRYVFVVFATTSLCYPTGKNRVQERENIQLCKKTTVFMKHANMISTTARAKEPTSQSGCWWMWEVTNSFFKDHFWVASHKRCYFIWVRNLQMKRKLPPTLSKTNKLNLNCHMLHYALNTTEISCCAATWTLFLCSTKKNLWTLQSHQKLFLKWLRRSWLWHRLSVDVVKI